MFDGQPQSLLLPVGDMVLVTCSFGMGGATDSLDACVEWRRGDIKVCDAKVLLSPGGHRLIRAKRWLCDNMFTPLAYETKDQLCLLLLMGGMFVRNSHGGATRSLVGGSSVVVCQDPPLACE